MRKRAVTPVNVGQVANLSHIALALVVMILSAVAVEAAASEEPVAPGVDRQKESIVIEPNVVPEPPLRPDYGFDVDVWTDRRTYEIGDLVRIYFRVTRPAYVHIFNTDTQGITRQLFPNYFDRDSYCVPGRRYFIPDGNYKLRVIGPPGTEHLRIVAVRSRPTFFERRYQFSPQEPFPTYPEGAKGFLREYERDRGRSGDREERPPRERTYREPEARGEPPSEPSARGPREVGARRPEAIVVEPPDRRTIVVEAPEPVYDREYAEAYTTFRVVDPWPQQPPQYYGEIRVSSVPASARIEVDGRYRGRTPEVVRYLEPGVHTVEVQLTGFDTWRQEVMVREGQSTSIHVRLNPRRPRFQFDFRF